MEMLMTYGIYGIVAIVVLLFIFQRNALIGVCKAWASKISDSIYTPETKLLTKKADYRDKIVGLNQSISSYEHQITNCKARNRQLEIDCEKAVNIAKKSTDEVEVAIYKKRAITSKQTIQNNNNKMVSYNNIISNNKKMIMLLEDKLVDIDTALVDLKTSDITNMAEINQILRGNDPELKEIMSNIQHATVYKEIAAEDTEKQLIGNIENVNEEFDALFGEK